MQEVDVKLLSFKEVLDPAPLAKPRELSTELSHWSDFRVGILRYPF